MVIPLISILLANSNFHPRIPFDRPSIRLPAALRHADFAGLELNALATAPAPAAASSAATGVSIGGIVIIQRVHKAIRNIQCSVDCKQKW